MNSKFLHDRRGFTLIEMLVATAVSSIVLLMVYTAYSSIIKAVKHGTVFASHYEELNLALSAINRDIANLYWRDDGKAGLLSTAGQKTSLLTFVTYDFRDMRITGNIKDEFPVFDIYRVTYYIAPEKEGEDNNLIRRKEAGYGEIDSEAGTEEIMLRGVDEFSLSFKEGNDWRNRWDTRENKRLPGGIRIEISLKNPSGNNDKFELLSIPVMANE